MDTLTTLSNRDALGTKAVQIVGVALGEPIAAHFIRHECKVMGYDFDALTDEQFAQLAKRITCLMCDIVGECYAHEMGSDLEQLVCSE